MKKAILAVFLAFLLSGCAKKQLVDSAKFPTNGEGQKITHLDVDVEAADIVVERSSDNTAYVDLKAQYKGATPSYSMGVEDSTLRLSFECSFSCEGKFIIKVPSHLTAKISLGAGNVSISELQNNIRVGTGAGNIELKNVSGAIDLKSGAGNISGMDLKASDCEANTGAGNIDLKMKGIPKRAKLRSGVGNVSVTVPTYRYNVSSFVGIGSQSVHGVTTDPSSPSSINISTGVGNVRINGV